MTQAGATFVEFTAQTRMSGVDLDRTAVRKGAGGQIVAWARSLGGSAPTDLADVVDGIARSGGTPLVVARCAAGQPARVLGVIQLKDVVKPGMT